MSIIEEWKDVVGYEGRYLVSNCGRMYSLYKNKIMKHKLDRADYCVIGLTKDGKQKVLKVHRLVANVFLEDFEEKDKFNYHVDHIDGNKQNNHISNLQMLTHYENCFKRTGRNAFQKIKAVCIETGEDFIFNGQNEAARVLGINQGNIYNALVGRIKQTQGYKFKRIDKKVSI
jgi:hypothetical protein